MADADDKNFDALDLEKQKRLALNSLLQLSVSFFENDVKFMESLQKLMKTFAAEAERDPSVLFSSKGVDVEALVAALKAKPQAAPGGISGQDIAGGIEWLDDLANFIEKAGEFIKDEKRVFLAILLLIFCKDSCKCLCDFINKE
ncbi:MAG TPA: hypothetical protein VNP98_15540 [Chthoniobacterales bacterium]|nr:hypothetical protein [Chthoniobacterales bacterium]